MKTQNRVLIKKIILLVFLLMTSPILVDAATIKGNVYNIFLEEIDKAIITVSTSPEQTVVSKEGYYELEVPTGKYTLDAFHEEDSDIYTAEQEIDIKKEGTYTIDLILAPEMEDYDLLEGLLEEEEILSELDEEKPSKLTKVIISILITLTILFLINRKNSKKPKEQEELQGESQESIEEVTKFIKGKGSRTTQKEIKKHFKFSAAKTSMIISTLEAKGTIKKIRKGRTNIIVLK